MSLLNNGLLLFIANLWIILWDSINLDKTLTKSSTDMLIHISSEKAMELSILNTKEAISFKDKISHHNSETCYLSSTTLTWCIKNKYEDDKSKLSDFKLTCK